ncbi:MBD6 isoform 10 [Pan troglodytes]|uniref:Methyl-CpG binding domain protein 6 n=2 Tax=Homininae TaxID=207598 RepID=F8VW40_HUMAN|nr:MBD6 isoform 10 [Pan troglodytes]
MNGGNESSGADRAGGPVATSVPIGWQRCVREGAVLYIRRICNLSTVL